MINSTVLLCGNQLQYSSFENKSVMLVPLLPMAVILTYSRSPLIVLLHSVPFQQITHSFSLLLERTVFQGNDQCYWSLPWNIVRTKWVVASEMCSSTSVSSELIWWDTQFWFKIKWDIITLLPVKCPNIIINLKCNTWIFLPQDCHQCEVGFWKIHQVVINKNFSSVTVFFHKVFYKYSDFCLFFTSNMVTLKIIK